MTNNLRAEIARRTDERWKPIPGYEGLYEVSNMGRVKSLARLRHGVGPHRASCEYRERIMLGNLNYGYRKVTLYKDGVQHQMFVHRLVLTAFVSESPSGMITRHLNGIRTDNRVENLAWGTFEENEADKRRHGTVTNGRRNHSAKATAHDVLAIRARHKRGETSREIAKDYPQMDYSNVWRIAAGISWRHVQPEGAGT